MAAACAPQHKSASTGAARLKRQLNRQQNSDRQRCKHLTRSTW